MNLIANRQKVSYLVMTLIVIFSFPGIYLSPIQQASPGDQHFKTFLPVLDRQPVETVFGAFLDAPGKNNGLAKIAAAGASWVRVPIYWSEVEPSAGQFTWQAVAGLDQKLKAISNNYINIILYINDTPAWALKSRLCLRRGEPGQVRRHGDVYNCSGAALQRAAIQRQIL